VVGLLSLALTAGASPASGDPVASSGYYLARGDPRLCPSPMCGGLWLKLVNVRSTICGGGERQKECYSASADLTRLEVSEAERARLQELFYSGRALARGVLARGRVEGFPELDVLVVSEVWTASSSRNGPHGVFRLLRDSGIRCVTTPCFSIRAAVLNTTRTQKVSEIDLSRSGARRAERRRAIASLSHEGLVAAGTIVRKPRAGPSGAGRTFVASQFYVRAG
jgi:hypothetical protein